MSNVLLFPNLRDCKVCGLRDDEYDYIDGALGTVQCPECDKAVSFDKVDYTQPPVTTS